MALAFEIPPAFHLDVRELLQSKGPCRDIAGRHMYGGVRTDPYADT